MKIINQILTINDVNSLIIELKKHFAKKCWPITHEHYLFSKFFIFEIYSGTFKDKS